MISKVAKIAMYAERFIELAKSANNEDEDFDHAQALREFTRLAKLINSGNLEEAVKFFDLLRTEGVFSNENGAEVMSSLVSNDNFKKFDEAYSQFVFERKMQKTLN